MDRGFVTLDDRRTRWSPALEIAQAVDAPDPPPCDVIQCRFEGGHVAMDVRDKRDSLQTLSWLRLLRYFVLLGGPEREVSVIPLVEGITAVLTNDSATDRVTITGV